MASKNQSWSYLEERNRVRNWLTKTPDGKLATELLRKNAPKENAAPILDDDSCTSWQDIVDEYKDGVMLASSCQEARGTYELARQAKSTMGLPGVSHARWNGFFSAPIGYVMRRQIQTGDPNYWNDPVNVYREALENPNWCRVPRSYLVGKLNDLLPGGKKIELATS